MGDAVGGGVSPPDCGEGTSVGDLTGGAGGTTSTVDAAGGAATAPSVLAGVGTGPSPSETFDGSPICPFTPSCSPPAPDPASVGEGGEGGFALADSPAAGWPFSVGEGTASVGAGLGGGGDSAVGAGSGTIDACPSP